MCFLCFSILIILIILIYWLLKKSFPLPEASIHGGAYNILFQYGEFFLLERGGQIFYKILKKTELGEKWDGAGGKIILFNK